MASYIEKNTSNGCRAYVLADTSYGKCCVDEVASQHVSADALIHYGPACLSANSRLPVLYVFGQPNWNVDECAAQIKAQIGPEQKLLVLCDVQFYYGTQELKAKLGQEYSNVVVASAPTRVDQGEEERNKSAATENAPESSPASSSEVVTDESNKKEEKGSSSEVDVNRLSGEQSFCGRRFEISKDSTMADYQILFVGGECATLTNILLKYNQLKVWSYDPSVGGELRKEGVGVNRQLMKRFYLIEKAKDADIIGIVVGTLAVARYMDILAYLKTIIKGSGKKYYTFVMGKLNIPKLANFAEIDIFVLVACPENSLLDSKEFFRPIVTPFELEIALVRGKEWSNQYSADFADVLASKDIKQLDQEIMGDGSADTEAEDVRISLISNKIRTNHKNAISISSEDDSTSNEANNKNDSSTALTQRANMDLALTSGPSASTVFLQRSFQGLQQRLGEDAPHAATEGRAGIASGYDEEGQ